MTSAFRYPWVAIGATAIAVMTAGFFQSAHAAGTSVESSQSVATVDSSQSATAGAVLPHAGFGDHTLTGLP